MSRPPLGVDDSRVYAGEGGAFMHACRKDTLNHVEAFPYLVALQSHHDEVADAVGEWMPWNYQATLARLHAAGA